MKRQAIVALLGVFLLASAAYGENDQKIIKLGSDAYAALTSLYLEQGLAPPSQSGPYSVDEFRIALARIDRSALSPAGKKTYDYVKSCLVHPVKGHEGKNLEFNSDPTVTIGFYGQTNPGAQNDSSEQGWVDRPPAINIPLEAWLFDSVYADVELAVYQDPFVAQNLTGDSDPSGFTGNPTNLPLSISELYEDQMPERAFISGGGPHWNVDFGRDTLSWGNGPFGNLILSDTPSYYDFLRFTTYWNNFKFTAAYIDLPPYFPGINTLNPTPTQIADAETADGTTNLVGITSMTKLMLSHRVEFRVWDRVTLAVSEAIVIGGIDPSLSLLNPLEIFHNWNIWETANDIASAEISVNPFKWLDLFVQYAQNQIGGSIEIYSGANDTPSAGGVLGGAQGSFPLGSGYVQVAAQVTETDPWLYIGGSPGNGAMPWDTIDSEQRYLSNFLGGDPVVATPVGWLYGPDSLCYNASVSYNVYGQYTAGIEFRYQEQGSNTLDTPHAYGPAAVALTTPSGPNPTDTTVVHLFGTWNLVRLFGVGVGLGGDTYFINVQNIGHVYGTEAFNVQLVGTVTMTF